MSGENINQNLTVQSVPDKDDHPPQNPNDSNEKKRLPKWRRYMWPGIAGLLLLGGAGWILLNRVILPLIIFSQMKPQPTMVQISSPKTASIEDSSDYAASLDSRQSVTLQPRVAGQISAIYVKAGDRVQAGTPILQIDSREQRAQVASRSAAVATAGANIEAAQADVANALDNLKAQQARRSAAASEVQLAQREYERYLNLYQQGAESKQIVDQRLNALQTAQANLRQVDADIRAQKSAVNKARATVSSNQRTLEQTQANVSESQAQLQYYTINAPFTGVIGNIPVKVGDFVDTSTQLLNVTQNRELEIRIQIPLERASDLRVGLPVKLLDSQDKEIQTGRISFIAPNVDATTQSVEVKARFTNSGDKLRTSQFVRARVIWDTQPGVLVPTSAISRLGGKDFIFVSAPFKDSGCKEPAKSDFGGPVKVEPDQLVAAQRPIELGKIVGNDQEVLKGVKAGDRIVTSGILQLQNCAPIAEGPPPAQAQ